ncbi:MAG TPA: hypothetical protein VHX86_10545 [Tepidisphaeraceae bacterium]|jgi:predicted RNA-binding Zn-ribbon protein involved in translation (DUF1610 family)|nr:hypothetical protein [Tepidisphaeraceae bacterium]
MADSGFFLRVRGKVSGPFDLPGLQKLVRRGMLSRIHEISSDQVTWNTAGEFEDLFPTTPPAPAPRPEASDAESTAIQLAMPVPDPSAQSVEVSPAIPEYEVETTRDCPVCGEEIQTSAIKCRHCGEWLDGRSRMPVLNYDNRVVPQQRTMPVRSYLNAAILTLILYVIGFGIVGLIANVAYLSSAKRTELETGEIPEGKGCLVALLWVFLWIPLIMLAGFAILLVINSLTNR